MAPSTKPSSGVFWHVLAPVIRWPLHSPARLAVVVGAVVAVLLVASTISKTDTPAATAAPTGTQTPATGQTTSTAPTPTPSATPSAQPVRVNQASASDTAVAFVRLWARPSVVQPQWSADLTPYSTTTYAKELTTVLPVNVPAQKVTGAKPPAMNSAGASVLVGTDVGTVKVALVRGDGGLWLVRSLVPEDLTPTGAAGSTIAPHYTPLPTP